MIVQSFEEIAQARIQECAPHAVAKFRPSVRPIYGIEKNALTHIGSCLLLEIDGRRVVSTAAHIADWLKKSPLFVAGLIGTHPVQIVGKVRTTTAPSDNRDLDYLDCAYWPVSDEAAAALGPVRFLDKSMLSYNRASTEWRVYTAFGYANSRNRKLKAIDRRTKSIVTRMSMYTGHLVEIPAAKATNFPESGAGHLFLNFEDCAWTANGELINTFGPKGLSGGALLDLGNFMPGDVYSSGTQHRALLSGMLIEHWSDHQVIVAVKIGSIVEGIRRSLPRR